MADYKDIISGTINSIVGKVKEVAESGAVRDIYENGANRAKSYGRIAAKEDEINALKADIAAATGCDEADIDVEIGEFDDFDNIVDATEDDGKNE